MLNYAASKAGEGRIPSHLLDIYFQYKQDTRAAIAWLLSHGTSKYKRLETLSIKDLFGLADIVQSKAVEMPEAVDFHFREAIAARSQMTKYFQKTKLEGKSGQNNTQHQFFTDSLTKIHSNLCAYDAKPKHKVKAHHRLPSQDSDSKMPNRFSALKLSHPEKQVLPNNTPCDCRCHVDREDGEDKTTPSKPIIPRLVDDTLCDAFELHKEMQDARDLLDVTADTWEQTARGKIPIVAATFITNAAFAAIQGIEHRLKTLCGVSDPKSVHKYFIKMQHGLRLSMDDEDCSSSSVKRLVNALKSSWHLLLEMKDQSPAGWHQKALSRLPSQLILGQGVKSTATDNECLCALLQNVGTHIRADYLQNNIIRIGTPIYAEVGYFLTHDEKDSDNNGLRSCYGLQLLLESYKSYLFAAGPSCPTSNCRLQALKFTQEAMTSISAVLDDSTMPCRCPGTLAKHLENLLEDFKEFLAA